MQRYRLACTIIAMLFLRVSIAQSNTCHCKSICSEDLYNQHPWSMMYFHGRTMSDGLAKIVILKEMHDTTEQLHSLELAYTLDQCNSFRQGLYSIVPVVQAAGNFTYRYAPNGHDIYEFNPFFIFRWVNFIWNPYVNTSLAIGEGVSYASSIPEVERNNKEARRLLNYLMFEATVAFPKCPRLQFVARIHHRSGAFGLYNAGRKDGTNALGLGVRFLF